MQMIVDDVAISLSFVVGGFSSSFALLNENPRIVVKEWRRRCFIKSPLDWPLNRWHVSPPPANIFNG